MTSFKEKAEKVTLSLFTFISVILLTYFLITLFLGLEAYQLASSDRTEPLYVERISFYILSAFQIEFPAFFPAEYAVLGLIVIYLLIISKTFLDGIRFDKLVKSSLKLKNRDFFKNSLASTIALTCFTIFTVVLLTALFERTGVKTGELNFTDPAVEYLEVAYAPIKEEIGFRLTFIGVFAVLAFYIRAKELNSEVLKGLIYPIKLKYKLSGEEIRSFERDLWTFIIISSVVFGVLHYLSGSGWEIGKIPLATISGVLLGFLYIYYGFPSCVFSHWIFNYVTQTTLTLMEKYSFLALGSKVMITFGLLTAIYLFFKGLERLLT